MRFLICISFVLASAVLPGQKDAWQASFEVGKAQLSSMGQNDYFVLQPGFMLQYKGGDVDLVITVLKETKLVDGVTTRVVEERETEGGKLIEVSRNFFAIDKRTGDVYYFGEDVDMYRNGKVVSHSGAWRSGVNGAKFGLMMPAEPTVGRAYYQEIAPKVAMDRARIVATDAVVVTPSKRFTGCVRVEETTPLEPGKGYKYYAKGIGMVQDDDLKLVSVGRT